MFARLFLASSVLLVGALFVDAASAVVEPPPTRSAFMDEASDVGHEVGPVLDPSNLGFISVPDGSAAAPYPSVAVSRCTGTIADVDLTIYNFSHDFPDDVDIVLQGPGGQSTKVMSDAGGSFSITSHILTFDDEAGSFLPDSTPIVRGSGERGDVHRPTNWATALDGMPAPSPDPTTASLAVFDGTSPVGTWRLFVLDDTPPLCPACPGSGAGGSIGGGWALTLTVTAPTLEKRVCIPHIGKGEPFPSDQLVSGLAGVVQDVNVTLSGLIHTFPDDLDVVLLGPAGQTVMLMSDVGSGFDVNGVSLTLDDEAAAPLPDSAQLTEGTFKPTDSAPGDVLPAPPGPYGTALAAFDGTNANGPWSLFVNDDAHGDKGFLSSWSLHITTPQGTTTVTPPAAPAPIPVAPPPTCPGFENDPRKQVVGNPGPDTLVGTPEKDILCGLGGDDKLSGAAANDLLLGGGGKDILRGQKGRDTLRGGPGPDKLFGGPGSDRCLGGPGDDSFSSCER